MTLWSISCTTQIQNKPQTSKRLAWPFCTLRRIEMTHSAFQIDWTFKLTCNHITWHPSYFREIPSSVFLVDSIFVMVCFGNLESWCIVGIFLHVSRFLGYVSFFHLVTLMGSLLTRWNRNMKRNSQKSSKSWGRSTHEMGTLSVFWECNRDKIESIWKVEPLKIWMEMGYMVRIEITSNCSRLLETLEKGWVLTVHLSPSLSFSVSALFRTSWFSLDWYCYHVYEKSAIYAIIIIIIFLFFFYSCSIYSSLIVFFLPWSYSEKSTRFQSDGIMSSVSLILSLSFFLFSLCFLCVLWSFCFRVLDWCGYAHRRCIGWLRVFSLWFVYAFLFVFVCCVEWY